MPLSRWERWAPITGALGAILIAVSFIAIGGSTPDTKDSAAKVVRFYTTHRDRQMAATFVVWWGASLLLFFAGSLRAALRRGTTGRLANIAFGGVVAAVAGFYVACTFHFALADTVKYAGPSVSRTLNILDNDCFFGFVGGLAVVGIAGGWSIVRSRVLPLWLGIVGIVAGVVSFTPLGFIGFGLMGIWLVIASIYLVARPVVVAAPAAAV